MLQRFPAGAIPEADAASRLIYDSDPAYYDFWFGSPSAALSCLAKLWTESCGSLSHAHATVWRLDGALAALACHYPAAKESVFSTEDLRAQQVLRGDLPALQHREAMLAWLFPHLPDDVWYLRTLAVSTGLRGQGFGACILEEITAIARAHGACALHTDVDSANHGAVRFYQSNGFEIVTETRVPALERYRLPASFRMSKQIG